MERKTITIPVSAPFSLRATVLSHGWHECAPMSWTEGGGCLQIIERSDGRAIRVSVTEDATAESSVTLRVTIEGEQLDPSRRAEVRSSLRRVLGLDQNLSEFFALCRKTPALRPVPRIGAGRTIRSADMTENVIKALCATNVNWTQAVKMINRLAQLGPCVPHFRSLNAWPTPREILRAGEGYLTGVCRVGYRAETILAFCRDVCEGRFDPAVLDAMAASPDVETDEILARLRSIRGIGPSSAHYLLSFLGRHDRLSIDSATIAHVAKAHLNGRRPTPKQIEKIYAPYGRWKNKVWWFEQWLTWGTARRILRDAGVRTTSPRRSPGGRKTRG